MSVLGKRTVLLQDCLFCRIAVVVTTKQIGAKQEVRE